MSSFAKRIQKLLEMLRLQALVEKKLEAPGFAHALGSNYDRISASQFHPPRAGGGDDSCEPINNIITFEYTLPQHLTLPLLLTNNKNDDDHHYPHTVASTAAKPGTSLSVLLAVLDEVTSWSALVGDLKRRRFGVSVSLRAEWAPSNSTGTGDNTGTAAATAASLFPGQTIRVSTTNSKIGKNLAFIDARVSDATTGEPIAFGSHIKYLDMGTFLNFALGEFGWPIAKQAVTRMEESPLATKLLTKFLPHDNHAPQQQQWHDDRNNNEFNLCDIFESLDFEEGGSSSTTTTRATFTPEHIHASLGGPLHGGCQAVLMELVGSVAAQRVLDVQRVTLESIQVDYLSTPSRGDVGLNARILSPSSATTSSRRESAGLGQRPGSPCLIKTQIISRDKVASQATLRFSAA